MLHHLHDRLMPHSLVRSLRSPFAHSTGIVDRVQQTFDTHTYTVVAQCTFEPSAAVCGQPWQHYLRLRVQQVALGDQTPWLLLFMDLRTLTLQLVLLLLTIRSAAA